MNSGPADQALGHDDGDLAGFPVWEDEDLFARDFEGRLIRVDKATAADLEETIKITVDGHEIEVKRAVPATDEQGNIRRDPQGRVIPRSTTIHDAATQLYREKLHASNPIPTLCHRDYMDPVGVCRVCVVQVSKFSKRTGRVEAGRKLLPACQHRVEKTMIVDTVESPDAKARARLHAAVKVLTELLMTDHPSPCVKERQNPGDCELEALARRFGSTEPRFERRKTDLPRDDSSLVIAVDHNACILCDRCVRGCDVIKENHVIGRMGKGYRARIAFDLDAPMGGSSCVACGECSDDCPTGALTHRRVIETKLAAGGDVSVDDLLRHELPQIREAFQGVSPAFLRSNIHAVRRRGYRKGDVICREGEYGSTAFFIEKGSVDIILRTPAEHVENQPSGGFWGAIGRFTTKLTTAPERRRSRVYPGRRPGCLTVRPATSHDGCRRHLRRDDLHELLPAVGDRHRGRGLHGARDAAQRPLHHAAQPVVPPRDRGEVPRAHDRWPPAAAYRFSPRCCADEARFRRIVDNLRPRVSLLRCEPGQVIFRQGDPASDGLYLIRTGFVKVSESAPAETGS